MENFIDAVPAASGPPQQEAESAFQLLKTAMTEHYLVQDTFFNEPEDLRELETDSALHLNVDLLLADPSY